MSRNKINRKRRAILTRYHANTADLGSHCNEQLASLLSGVTAGSATQRYWATHNNTIGTPAATLNTDCWTASMDLAAISAFRSTKPYASFPVILVSNRHILFPWHTNVLVGETIVFRRTAGTFQTVTVSSTDHVSSGGNDVDLGVGYLSAAITGVTPFKMLPADWIEKYAPSLLPTATGEAAEATIPPFIIQGYHDNTGAEDTLNWVGVLGMSSYINDPAESIDKLVYQAPSGYGALAYDDGNVYAGDSGSVVYLVINGEPIPVFGVEDFDWSSSWSVYTTEINTIMTTLAGGAASLTHPDLGAFTVYN